MEQELLTAHKAITNCLAAPSKEVTSKAAVLDGLKQAQAAVKLALFLIYEQKAQEMLAQALKEQ